MFPWRPKGEKCSISCFSLFFLPPPAVLQTGGLQVRGLRGLRLPRLHLHLLHPDHHRAVVSRRRLKYALISSSNFYH